MSAADATPTHEPDDRVAMLLSLVPGLGQLYLGHTVLGAVFFASCLTSLNVLFLGTQLRSLANTDVLWWLGLLSLIAVWLGSIRHTYLQSYGTDRLRLAQSRETLLRSALIDYLRDELEVSVQKLEKAIDLDVDWQDPDPYFHLGVVSLRLAEKSALINDSESARTARRRSQWAFRTCLSRDLTNKWRAEIGRESKRMRKLLSVTGRLRSLTQSGRVQSLSAESGSFPELRESNVWRRPGSMTMEKLREAKEGGRESGVLSELSAELEEVRRAPRTRRTSRKMKKKILEDRLEAPVPEDLPEPILGGPQDDTVDLTQFDAQADAGDMLVTDDTVSLPAAEIHRSDTRALKKAEVFGATEEPIPEAMPSTEGGMPLTRKVARNPKLDKRPGPGAEADDDGSLLIPPTNNAGLKEALAEAEAEAATESRATQPHPGMVESLRAEAPARPATEGGIPGTRKENREELLARADELEALAAAAEPEVRRSKLTESGPPDTRKSNQAELLARADELAAQAGHHEVEGGMPPTNVPTPKNLSDLAAKLAASDAIGPAEPEPAPAGADDDAETEGGIPSTDAPKPKNLDELSAKLAAADSPESDPAGDVPAEVEPSKESV